LSGVGLKDRSDLLEIGPSEPDSGLTLDG
jgi:hypothetical protein